MVADKLHLAAEGSSGNGSNSSSSRVVEVVFGCENMETGEIYKQRVDGVLGMGNNVNSLPRQVGVSLVTGCCVREACVCMPRDIPGTWALGANSSSIENQACSAQTQLSRRRYPAGPPARLG